MQEDAGNNLQYGPDSSEQPVMMQDGADSGSSKAGCNMGIASPQLEAAVHCGILGPDALLVLDELQPPAHLELGLRTFEDMPEDPVFVR